MVGYRKYGLLICLLILALQKGYANSIDSLSTKKEVQEFLIVHLGKTGIIFQHSCATISQAPKIPIYLSIPDTTMVEDPVTREAIKVAMPRDSGSLSTWDTAIRPVNYSLDEEITWRIKKHLNRFDKLDIDGDGDTDLVADAGILLILVDMGDRIEGHMFTNNVTALLFRDIISLPDGSRALLVTHNHEFCTPPPDAQMEDVYVTDTTIDSTVMPAVMKIDTLYMTSRLARQGPQCNR